MAERERKSIASGSDARAGVPLARRSAIKRILGCLGAGGLALLGRDAGGSSEPAIVQPEAPSPEAFMRRAFDMRKRASDAGDQPYGAVVVKEGRIVGEAPSRVVTGRDPTAHAEVEAIRDAARRLGTRDLRGCVIFASFRPCPMCESASYWAGIARVYHGDGIADAGQPRYLGC